jgi:nucleoside-diphosphate-sugar epimerase
MSWPTILVIGAGGFIGGWVTETLYTAGATNVCAAVRRPNDHRLAHLPVKTAFCDILDPGSLDAAMAGADIIINCVRDQTGNGATVEGTRRILECAAAHRVRRLIQLSSVAVYGDARGLITEETLPTSGVNQYGTEKRKAEELCCAASGSHLSVAILRPSLVYGPFGEEWTARYIRGILSGRLKRLGTAGAGEANLIYAGDLARFAVHLATTDIPTYSIYNANGGDIRTFDQYFDCLSRALGRGPLAESRKSGPELYMRRQFRRVGRYALRQQRRFERVLRGNPRLADIVKRFEDSLRYGIGDEPSDHYARHIIYSMEKARRVGFEPRISLDEGLRASVDWARQTKLTE